MLKVMEVWVESCQPQQKYGLYMHLLQELQPCGSSNLATSSIRRDLVLPHPSAVQPHPHRWPWNTLLQIGPWKEAMPQCPWNESPRLVFLEEESARANCHSLCRILIPCTADRMCTNKTPIVAFTKFKTMTLPYEVVQLSPSLVGCLWRERPANHSMIFHALAASLPVSPPSCWQSATI